MRDCLYSIKSAAPASVLYEIIVVDNGSTDGSQTVARDNSAILLEIPDVNVGELRNIGAEHASGDFLAFIDADCTVEPDWFEAIAPYMADKQIVCFGSPPKPPANGTWVQQCWYQIRKKTCYQRKAFEVEWLESMNLLCEREAFLNIGGFDQTMITCEDYDLCMRIAEIQPVFCDLRIVAIHHGEARTVSEFYGKERWRGVSNLHSLKKHGFDRSEIPSVAVPLIHLLICLLVLIGLVSVLFSSAPPLLPISGVLIWQVPLLILSFKKNGSPLPLTRIFGIVALLNVYFFARGLSLFSTASWKKSTGDNVASLVFI